MFDHHLGEMVHRLDILTVDMIQVMEYLAGILVQHDV